MKLFNCAQPLKAHNMYQQRGISLLMVMLVLILVALTSLSASRSSFFNETVTSNEADYNRALSAAEALIRDAQLDILGQTAAGGPCNLAANFIGCRTSPTGVPTQLAPYFPEDAAEGHALHQALTAPTYCAQGICSPPLVWPPVAPYPLLDNFWLTPATLIANQAFAATYGQFTGAAPAATGNPILTAIPRRAWYWTELVDFSVNLCVDPAYAAMCIDRPATNKPFIYRITAVAQGRGATIAVIQTFYTPYPK
jgi:type IV pilus assembly protein PilX